MEDRYYRSCVILKKWGSPVMICGHLHSTMKVAAACGASMADEVRRESKTPINPLWQIHATNCDFVATAKLGPCTCKVKRIG